MALPDAFPAYKEDSMQARFGPQPKPGVVLGMGKYSYNTFLVSTSLILCFSKGLYISSSTKKYITLDYLIIYTSYARVAKSVPMLTSPEDQTADG